MAGSSHDVGESGHVEPSPPSSRVRQSHTGSDGDQNAESYISMNALLLCLTEPFSDKPRLRFASRRCSARLRARLDLPNEITCPTNVALISSTT